MLSGQRRWNRDRRKVGNETLLFWSEEQQLMMLMLGSILTKAGHAESIRNYDGTGESFGQLVRRGFTIEDAPGCVHGATSVGVVHDPTLSRPMANRYAASIIAAFRAVLGAQAGRLVHVGMRRTMQYGDCYYASVTLPSERALKTLYQKLGPR